MSCRYTDDRETDRTQAQKFASVEDDDDDELEEESLLETPLDKVEPYSMFKEALLRMFDSCNSRNIH